MRQRHLMTGLDMEQDSQSFPHPDLNIDPNFEPHSLQEPYDNNSMFYGHPQYHHHQHASNFGPGMSTPPNFYAPHAAYHAPPSHPLAPGSHGAAIGVTSTEHERNAHFMGHGYKRKSAEVIPMPGNFQYLSTAEAAPCSFPPEIVPFSYPQYGSTYTQPVDQRSVRNRAGPATMDPPLSHGHNNFIQGNYAAPPFPPPGSIWYDQHCNANTSDASSSLWPQAPSVPYMHGNAVAGSIDTGNVCFPRYHETSSSTNPTSFVYPGHNYFSHPAHPPPPPPPPTVYPHRASASYSAPVTFHDASYSHVGPVQSAGFRIFQNAREDFVPAATLRRPRFRGIPTDEFAVFGEGDYYDDDNYVDRHQDMRLDIEDMSYEELLALSDHIGTVKTGLSEEDVEDLLKRRTSSSTRINLEEVPSTDIETDPCMICQENYENQDKIATLDCKHEYHAECLKKWLVIKNICPICKSEALVMEKKNDKV